MKEIHFITMGFALVAGIAIAGASSHTEYMSMMSYVAGAIFAEIMKRQGNKTKMKRRRKVKGKQKRRNHSILDLVHI